VTFACGTEPANEPKRKRGNRINPLLAARAQLRASFLEAFMNVLLTGGYGCIGSWITKNLLERGERVWIYDLKEDPKRMRLIMDEEAIRRVQFIEGDVTDLSRLRGALSTHQITHIVHLAGLQVPVCRADPILGAKVNVIGTLAVFEAVRPLQGQIQRLVYTSSAAVFGPPEHYLPSPPGRGVGGEGRLPDDALLTPSTHYGVFKCCNEGNARIYFQDAGISSVGLRPWTVYGVGRDFGMTSEPTKAIKSLALNRSYHISYGGMQDLQYVDDVAKIAIRCLEAPYQGAKSYNLRGHVVDLPTFHRALCEVDSSAATRITFGERQIAIAYDLDDSALQRDLGPMPITPLVEGIRLTLDRFRKLNAEGRLDTVDLDAK
jgi:nucleoside-diphosphate-sugar epimerase